MAKINNIISNYMNTHQGNATQEWEWYANRKDLNEAITVAGLAQRPCDKKRHSHQYKIPRKALEESKNRLLHNKDLIGKVSSFDELHGLVEKIIKSIYKIGELVVYDTSCRLGAFLGLKPTRVYLHAGTKEGTRNLGIETKGKTLPIDALPPPLRKFSAGEIEDILCIYKGDFKSDTKLPLNKPSCHKAGKRCGCHKVRC